MTITATEAPRLWGVLSPLGIGTIAKHGEEQARKWATHKFGPIGAIGEVLAVNDGQGWKPFAIETEVKES